MRQSDTSHLKACGYEISTEIAFVVSNFEEHQIVYAALWGGLCAYIHGISAHATFEVNIQPQQCFRFCAFRSSMCPPPFAQTSAGFDPAVDGTNYGFMCLNMPQHARPCHSIFSYTRAQYCQTDPGARRSRPAQPEPRTKAENCRHFRMQRGRWPCRGSRLVRLKHD